MQKNLCFGAISVYIALRDPIYTLHNIYIFLCVHVCFIYFLQKLCVSYVSKCVMHIYVYPNIGTLGIFSMHIWVFICTFFLCVLPIFMSKNNVWISYLYCLCFFSLYFLLSIRIYVNLCLCQCILGIFSMCILMIFFYVYHFMAYLCILFISYSVYLYVMFISKSLVTSVYFIYWLYLLLL